MRSQNPGLLERLREQRASLTAKIAELADQPTLPEGSSTLQRYRNHLWEIEKTIAWLEQGDLKP